MLKILGIAGLKGSGKDTIGDIICKNKSNWVKMSFADTLKDIVSILFGWDRDMVEGSTHQSREWREIPDKFWSEKLSVEWTPRKALQYLGTELFRNHLNQNIWVDSLEKKIENTDKSVVITDVRFENEMEMIRKLGGKIWRVERGVLPEWFKKVESWNVDKENLKYDIPYFVTEIKNIHESEWRWIGVDKPDKIIYNNGTIEDLEKEIINLIAKE